MAHPTQSIDWAIDNVAEYVSNQDGDSVLVANKEEPSTSFKLSGFLARAFVPRAYLNYILNALSVWIKYNNEGEVGDLKLMPSGTTSTEVEARFKNTWSDLGTDTIAGEIVQVFKRTA